MTTYTIRADVPRVGLGFAVAPISVELSGVFTREQAEAIRASPALSNAGRNLLRREFGQDQPDYDRAQYHIVALDEPDYEAVIRLKER